MKRIIIAPDSFKGSLSSKEVAIAVCDALEEYSKETKTGIECINLCISDGGEGFCEAVTWALKGKFVPVETHDALMRPIIAKYGLIDNECAIIDVASTVGLTLLRKEELDPINATSYGVGEMIAHIISKGIKKIIIGLGGSATNDCGKGMLEALQDKGLLKLTKDGKQKVCNKLDECEFIIASDVSNPLYGPNGATYVFAKQKGAIQKDLPILDKRNLEYGKFLEEIFNRPIIYNKGAGAAGGIGAALMTMKNYTIKSGIDLVLDLYNFDVLLDSASLVITGEGKIDSQTLNGKAPYGIAMKAKKKNVPCWAICGTKEECLSVENTIWDKIISVSPSNLPLSEAIKPEIAKENIKKTILKCIREY